jgi:hypothetical protein
MVVSNVIPSQVVETCVAVMDVVVDVLSTEATVSRYVVVVVVKDVLVVNVYVYVQYVGDVRITLTVSTNVELVVDATVVVTVGLDVAATTVFVVVGTMMGDVATLVTVDDVVTIEEKEYTVVETVGPSGCLTRPILLPPYSVNQTLTIPFDSVMARPWGLATDVIMEYSANSFLNGRYLPILLA